MKNYKSYRYKDFIGIAYVRELSEGRFLDTTFYSNYIKMWEKQIWKAAMKGDKQVKLFLPADSSIKSIGIKNFFEDRKYRVESIQKKECCLISGTVKESIWTEYDSLTDESTRWHIQECYVIKIDWSD